MQDKSQLDKKMFDNLSERFWTKSSFGKSEILCVFRIFQSAELGQKIRSNCKEIFRELTETKEETNHECND